MDDYEDPTGVKSVAVSSVVSSALIAALIAKLAEKNILSDMDTRDIYDDALHGLELQQAAADGETIELFRLARQVIEEPLKET